MKKNSINFNHISEDLSDEEIMKLKQWYVYYHKLYTCYKWKYKKLKKVNLSLNMVSLGLTVSGTIADGITLNSIILGCISGPGILIQGYLSKSNIKTKTEMCRYAYTSYQKILTQLKSYLRGMTYDESILLSDLKIIDDIVTDLCPLINGMSKKYDKIYDKI